MSKAESFSSPPFVSVVLCVFNGEAQVGLAIEDILAQTYPNFELVISDDSSTDGTCRVLERYADHPRVRIFRQPVNLGFLANKNFAIGKAYGELITQQDHDDRSDLNRLERQVQAMTDTGLSVSACGVRRLNLQGTEISRIGPAHDLIVAKMPSEGVPFFFPPIMFSREVWEKHGPFSNYFAGAFGEDNYFISCVLRTHPIIVISECLYDYIDTRDSVTSRIRQQRALAIVPILTLLAEQNSTLGTNDLEQGNFDILSSLECRILADRLFVAEQYRVYAARAIDHHNFLEGARLIGKSAALNPLSTSLARTAGYWLRRMAARIR